MNPLKDKIHQASETVIRSEGFELVELNIRGSSNRTIQFVIDGNPGVSINDCVKISRQLSDVIDPLSDEWGLERYRLEVSSAGLDRPLKSQRHFQRNLGRQIELAFRKGEKVQEVVGSVKDADSDGVTIVTPNGELRVLYQEIQRAKIKLKW